MGQRGERLMRAIFAAFVEQDCSVRRRATSAMPTCRFRLTSSKPQTERVSGSSSAPCSISIPQSCGASRHLRRTPSSHGIRVRWNTHLLPLLTYVTYNDLRRMRQSMGDLARVQQVVRQRRHHPTISTTEYPYNDPDARSHLQWDTPTAQQVLDVALAFAVINRHFDVADVLLEHGANINTNWNSHEPASILHQLVILPNPYESMRFLIDRGIDMTIRDYRWDSNAVGWARYGYNDEKLAQWLEDAERQRAQEAISPRVGCGRQSHVSIPHTTTLFKTVCWPAGRLSSPAHVDNHEP